MAKVAFNKNREFLRSQVLNGWTKGRKSMFIYNVINSTNAAIGQISYSVICSLNSSNTENKTRLEVI